MFLCLLSLFLFRVKKTGGVNMWICYCLPFCSMEKLFLSVCNCSTLFIRFKISFPVVFFLSPSISFCRLKQHRTVFLRQLLMCGSFCRAMQKQEPRWVHAIAKCFMCLNVEWRPVIFAAHVCLHGASSVQAVHVSCFSAQLSGAELLHSMSSYSALPFLKCGLTVSLPPL